MQADARSNIEFTFLMNSSCEDVFAFKTCCGMKVFDLNLEIHVKNQGTKSVSISSRFELYGDAVVTKIENLMPAGPLKVDTGEIKAFYCSMDEALFKSADHALFFDTVGRRYQVPLKAD
jgi:hypothetical protein